MFVQRYRVSWYLGNHEKKSYLFLILLVLPEREHCLCGNIGGLRIMAILGYRANSMTDITIVKDQSSGCKSCWTKTARMRGAFCFCLNCTILIIGTLIRGRGFYRKVELLLEDVYHQTGKPSIHFFSDIHGLFKRNSPKDHKHLWIKVASGRRAIDKLGTNFEGRDYALNLRVPRTSRLLLCVWGGW